MASRAYSLLVLAALSACGTDTTVVVARMQRSSNPSPASSGTDAGNASKDADTGGAPFFDPGAAIRGPANAWWSLFQEGDATAEWGDPPPSVSSVSVVANSPPQKRAGLHFKFGLAPGETLDLSQFYQLEVNLSAFTEGEGFEVFLGNGLSSGCSYRFKKTGSYKASLASPAWCIPSQCGFDLRVTEGLFLADVPDTSRLSATLTDLKFTKGAVAAGSASALGGAIGPGEFCWFLANWSGTDATASWKNQAAPNTSFAHVEATAVNGSIGGMAFEIPRDFELSQYGSLVLDATISIPFTHEPTSFRVQAVKQERGFGWNLQGDGSPQTYTLDLVADPGFVFGGERLPLSEVERIEIVTPSSGGTNNIDAKVTRVAFVPKSAQ
ncbi:MAG TPA: hypothetical protein VKP30_01740 [Polyangiaceae bacterium]|nr:hypothetical protein [Polyangiaceae bacterium]